MDWKEYIQQLYARNKSTPPEIVPQFYKPCSSLEIQTLEKTLGLLLSDELRTLLLQTNGIGQQMEIDKTLILIGHLVEPMDQILAETKYYRDQWQRDPSQRPMLFFGRPGVDGILFGAS